MPDFPSSAPINPWISSTDYTPILYVAPIWGTEPPPRQNDTGPLITISYPHHEIHDGSYFIAGHLLADTSALADDATYDMSIRPSTDGTGKDLHATLQVKTGGNAESYLYEGTNADTDGTDVVVYNLNRASTEVSDVQIQIDPTINTIGTLIHPDLIPGGAKVGASGGASRSGSEWILSRDSVYLLRAINRAGSAQPASLHAEWYEHSER